MTNQLKTPSSISITIPEHILFQQLEGEAVLLDVKSGGYYGLNEVGTFIWETLANGRSLGDVITAMCRRYNVEESKASQDVQQFMSDLKTHQLVIVDDQAS